MMRLAIICLLLLSSCEAKKNLKYQIKEVLKTQEKAWNRGDINAFMQGYWQNDSMQFITQRGIRFGWQETLESYKKSYPTKEKMGQLSFSNLRIKEVGEEIGHATGNWKLSYPNDTSLGGHFSLLFKTFNQEPKIIVDHTW